MNHGAEAALETVFATCRGTVDRNFRVSAQNPGDGQNFAPRRALERENVRVLAFECSELVLDNRLVAGKEGPGQKRHLGGQEYKDNASHTAISFGLGAA